MKDAVVEIKREVKAKLLYLNSIKSRKLKVALITAVIAIVTLKVYTTVVTFDWLVNLFN